MTKTAPHVQEANRENFDTLVLGNSRKGLVLVHFWTPKAGPCMILMPRLVQLAADYGGRFLLVLANTDDLGRVAHEQSVNSVPTVKFYLNGATVHTIHGAEPDSTFRAALARFISLEDSKLRQEALRAHQAGRTEESIGLLARAAVDEPENLGISADLAKLLLLSGQAGQALDLLSSLPAQARLDDRIAPLLVHLELIDAAENGPETTEATLDKDSDDTTARLTLAARALFRDERETAMAHLLTLSRTHPEFRQDIGRRALLALFQMLGPEHPLTRRYRSRLATGVS